MPIEIMLTSASLSNPASLMAALSSCDWPSVRRTMTSRTFSRSPRRPLKICENRKAHSSYGVDKIIQLIQLRLSFQSQDPRPLSAKSTMGLHTICNSYFRHSVVTVATAHKLFCFCNIENLHDLEYCACLQTFVQRTSSSRMATIFKTLELQRTSRWNFIYVYV